MCKYCNDHQSTFLILTVNMNSKVIIFVLIVALAFGADAVTKGGGCYKSSDGKKYCWAYCSTGLVRGIADEWCYTTQSGRSQDYNYVECSEDSQCDYNWSCAGPCTMALG